MKLHPLRQAATDPERIFTFILNCIPSSHHFSEDNSQDIYQGQRASRHDQALFYNDIFIAEKSNEEFSFSTLGTDVIENQLVSQNAQFMHLTPDLPNYFHKTQVLV